MTTENLAPQLNPWQLGGVLPPGIAFEAIEPAVEPAAPAPAGEPSGGPTATDAGAAVPSPEGEPSGEPAAPAPFNFGEWAQTPEGRQELGSTFQTWAETQASEQAAREAAEARANENPFSDVEEALGLLGIDGGRFREYVGGVNGSVNAPLFEAANELQTQKSVAWVDSQLAGLGTAHPDLLGDGVDKLAEIVDAEGNPLFNPEEVRGLNRNAVLFGASALSTASLDANGNPTLAHDVALSEAAKQVAARDEVVGKVAVQKYIADLENRGTAPRSVDGNGAAGGIFPTGIEGGDETHVARRIIAERRAG